MRDAMGGLINIVIIVVFMVIVSGYMAFNVNYTKAFKVKNKIISTYEQFEGNCSDDSSECMTIIGNYMNSVGYDRGNTPQIKEKGYNCRSSFGFCVKEVDASVNDNQKKYYKIVTQITIDIPIINKIMPYLNTFQVSGDTKTITKRAK